MREKKRKEKKKRKKIFGVLITQNPAAVFRQSPEFAPSDCHDFWTEASLHIKEGFDHWDLDFEAWKFCFLPGQIASCLVIFFLFSSLFVAIYLDIDSKIMMIVKRKMEDLLYVKDYYLPVFSTEKPENKTDTEWTILHRQVCVNIRGDFGVVMMGNTGLSRIAGIGDICLKFNTWMELVLHNVKHVPDMRLNIILTGLLDEDGYHNSSENDDMTELWHKRLGHMSEKRMSILSKKNVLSGVHDIILKKCSHCLVGKQTRRAFKSRPSFRTENILDLVHSDVCDPMKTKTLGGCSYFVTFIDDHSRKVWIYTLKTKDQVLNVFK
ncbi:putative RNA-directed DNA polymerase [Tanacetum coccineum]